MFLDAAKVPEIHRLLASEKPEAVEKISGAEVSLTGSLFLALSHRSFIQTGKFKMAGAIAQLDLSGVTSAIKCLEHAGPQLNPDPFGAPSFDLYRIGCRQGG